MGDLALVSGRDPGSLPLPPIYFGPDCDAVDEPSLGYAFLHNGSDEHPVPVRCNCTGGVQITSCRFLDARLDGFSSVWPLWPGCGIQPLALGLAS